MASHPKHAIGTNGNGKHAGGATSEKRIARLLAYHDGIANALRTTLAVLRGEAVEHREHRAPDVLAAAVQIDAARREHVAKPQRVHDGTFSRRRAHNRQETASILEMYHRDKPLGAPQRRGKLGVLVQHGYLKKVRGGYVRTAKEFQP